MAWAALAPYPPSGYSSRKPSPRALAVEALAVMNEHQVTSLFVLPPDAEEPATPVGIIHIHDCLRAGLS